LRVAQSREKLLDTLQPERDPLPPIQLGADGLVGEGVIQG